MLAARYQLPKKSKKGSMIVILSYAIAMLGLSVISGVLNIPWGAISGAESHGIERQRQSST